MTESIGQDPLFGFARSLEYGGVSPAPPRLPAGGVAMPVIAPPLVALDRLYSADLAGRVIAAAIWPRLVDASVLTSAVYVSGLEEALAMLEGESGSTFDEPQADVSCAAAIVREAIVAHRGLSLSRAALYPA